MIGLACLATLLASLPVTGGDMQSDAYARVILARSGANVVILWNATPVVAQIVAHRTTERVANDELERGALRAALRERQTFPRAQTIVVRVLFDRTGAVSRVYGDATFAGVERYALLTIDGMRARRDTDHWQERIAHAALPAWIRYRVIGSLPPR